MIQTAEVEARVPEEVERMFREHPEFIFRTAYRVTGKAEDAEDIVQALFTRILRHKFPAGIEGHEKAYLYRSAVNASLNLVRQRRRVTGVESSPATDSRLQNDATRGQSEMTEALRLALAELNPKAAEILILRHVHGYSDVEIARLVGTSRGTIAVSLFRSRRLLRRAVVKILGESL